MSTMTGSTGSQNDKSQAYNEAYFILKAANEREAMKRLVNNAIIFYAN